MADSLGEMVERAQQVKAKYEPHLLKKKNVVGVGIGFKHTPQGENIAIMVNVAQKEPLSALAEEDRIPKTLEDFPVDVVVVGEIQAF